MSTVMMTLKILTTVLSAIMKMFNKESINGNVDNHDDENFKIDNGIVDHHAVGYRTDQQHNMDDAYCI
jgi:hypothetical protein